MTHSSSEVVHTHVLLPSQSGVPYSPWSYIPATSREWTPPSFHLFGGQSLSWYSPSRPLRFCPLRKAKQSNDVIGVDRSSSPETTLR